VVLCALLLVHFKSNLEGLFAVVGWGILPRILDALIEIFKWIAFGWLASGIIQTLLWPGLEKYSGHPVPKLLEDIVTAVIVFAIILSVSAFVLHAPLSGLIAGSSILAAIIGLAINPMLADVFSGMALSVERAYNIGDWLEVENRSRPGGSMIGRVVEINATASRWADKSLLFPTARWPGPSSSITASPKGITGRKSRLP
jgi:small-conductance mechanosensitive channel